MQRLQTNLKKRVEGASRIAVLAVGSSDRGDDAAGVLIGQLVERGLTDHQPSPPMRVFHGENVPENLLGSIREYAPTHVIIVDAAEIRKKPGEIGVYDPDESGEAFSASTHRLPVSILAAYLRASANAVSVLIGIQPSSVEYGQPPCREVKSAARRAATAILGCAGVKANFGKA